MEGYGILRTGVERSMLVCDSFIELFTRICRSILVGMSPGGFDAALLATLLDAVGAHLEAAGAAVSIVVVGGAALALHGWVPRTTHDVDVIALASGPTTLIAPRLPDALLRAVARVARDFDLPEHWLNPAVGAQWRSGLPEDLAADLEWRTFRTLRVGLAGRAAMLALKLFAAVDRGPASVHLQDLLALAPTDGELARASAWVVTQDIAPQWPQLVTEVTDHVRNRRRHR